MGRRGEDADAKPSVKPDVKPEARSGKAKISAAGGTQPGAISGSSEHCASVEIDLTADDDEAPERSPKRQASPWGFGPSFDALGSSGVVYTLSDDDSGTELDTDADDDEPKYSGEVGRHGAEPGRPNPWHRSLAWLTQRS